MTTRSKTHKATFASNKASMRPDTKGERPPLSHDHRTHGRIKTGKKRFYAIWIATKSSLDLLPIETLWKAKVHIFQRVPDTKEGIFEGGRSIYRLRQNRILTGNKTTGAVKQKKVYNFLSL